VSKRPYQPRREDVRPDELELYDRVIARQTNYGYDREPGTEAGPHFGALLQAPVVADHLSELGVYYRTRGETEGSFSHAQREWVDLVLGNEMSPPILWGHMLDAVASGVRPEAIKALMEGRDWDLEREELMLATYIRQVVTGRVTQASYDAIEELLGVRGAVDYTAWISHLHLTARLQDAMNPQGWPGMKELAWERMQSLVDGTAELPEGPRVPPALAARG
jgi:hypothetical protein